ncbi:MFS transporter [Methylomicrobium lacus]|uniref:MFS transporter n=1 Tax=Methylomicrobium lacus TaxID=136992 RepID=UPI0035A8E5F1
MSVPYWRLSGFYLFYFGTLGGFLPYWNLYLKQLGLDAVQIGNLSAVLVGTRIIAPNFWGWIADRTGRSLRLIRVTLFCSAVAFSGFLAVRGYVELAACTFGFGVFWNASLPLFEAVTLAHLGDDAHRYSRIRLWGSIGFIVTVLGLGWWFDRQPIAQLPLFLVTLLLLNWIVTLMLGGAAPRQSHAESTGVLSVLRKTEVLAFLVVSMLLQAAHGPYYVFYSIYLQQLGYSAATTGSLWALGVFAEIILFIFMRPLLGRFSLRGILLWSLLLATARWWLIGWYATNPALLVSAQLLHAASFGSAHIAAIHLVQQYFGEQHLSKGQALYSSFSFGIGGMLGSLYSGYYWDRLGAGIIFSVAALACFLAFVVAAAGMRGSMAKSSRQG